MALTSYSAKAPGTLMLCGEHAVLKNRRAIVFAIDKWIKVTLKPRSDFRVVIYSALGRVEMNLHDVQIQKPFEFVFAVIVTFKEQLSSGFELTIESEFKEDVGLGSSAAVTVATVAVLDQCIKGPLKGFTAKDFKETDEDFQLRIFEAAKAIVQAVQGVGSGADVAASVYGGILQYQQQSPYVLKKMPYLLPLVVIYSGSKTPTPIVVKKVEDLRKTYPNVLEALYEALDASVDEATTQIEKGDWVKLGAILNIQQGIMNALGVGMPLLNQIIDILNQKPFTYGAKISGSGLGDCIIGICNKVALNGLSVLSDKELRDLNAVFKMDVMKMNANLNAETRSSVYEIPLAVSLRGLQCK